MAIEYKLDVKVSHRGKGTKRAEEVLLHCFEQVRFWEVLQPLFEQGLRATVEEVAGESFNFSLAVVEDPFMRYIRQRSAEARAAADAKKHLKQGNDSPTS